MSSPADQQSNLLKLIGTEKDRLRRLITDKLPWVVQASQILAAIEALPEAKEFINQPFSGHPALFAEYKTKIPHEPMWIRKVEERLLMFSYTTREEFLADCRKIFDNCYAFNVEATPFPQLARTVELYFEEEAVKRNLDSAIDPKEIRVLWKDLSPKEKSDISREVMQKYEPSKDGGRVSKDATKRRLVMRLRERLTQCHNALRHEGRSSTMPHTHTAAAPHLPNVKVPDRENREFLENEYKRARDESEQAALDDSASKVLPQNKHHHTFFEAVSPAFSAEGSPNNDMDA